MAAMNSAISVASRCPSPRSLVLSPPPVRGTGTRLRSSRMALCGSGVTMGTASSASVPATAASIPCPCSRCPARSGTMSHAELFTRQVCAVMARFGHGATISTAKSAMARRHSATALCSSAPPPTGMKSPPAITPPSPSRPMARSGPGAITPTASLATVSATPVRTPHRRKSALRRTGPTSSRTAITSSPPAAMARSGDGATISSVRWATAPRPRQSPRPCRSAPPRTGAISLPASTIPQRPAPMVRFGRGAIIFTGRLATAPPPTAPAHCRSVSRQIGKP